MPNYRKNKVLLAVITGNPSALEDALEKGFDPNMPGPSQMTALHMAALLCNEAAVKRLIGVGALLEARDKNDLTPLGYAVLPAKETPMPQLKLSLKTPEGRASLDAARLAIREELLAAGANWDAPSRKAPTPRERFEHYWPEETAQLKGSSPAVRPAGPV